MATGVTILRFLLDEDAPSPKEETPIGATADKKDWVNTLTAMRNCMTDILRKGNVGIYCRYQ